MAVSLVESAKLSQDMLQKGVIETMVRTSAVLEVLPFMEIVGNAYVYNQVSTLPTVAFRDVNEGYVEASASFNQKTASLKMLGGDVDVDKFIAETRGNINDQRAIQTELKAKAVAESYTATFFYGDVATNSKSFDGLAKFVTGGQDIAVEDTANGTLTLQDLNKLIDAVPFGADVLFMSRTTRRIVMNILQASQHYVEVGVDAFGKPVTMYAGIPIRICEDAVMPAQGDSGADGSEIFAVKFGAMSDVCGIQNGGVRVTDIGELETKPVYRTRIEWYCGLAVFNPKSVARLKGIKK
ncbi:TPA: major capsid protein [Clostridium botulinum]|uniref:major capsid protein n=1 Tax=Clostridium botulinum TaxID=1491 RepID=UPI001C9B6F3C|nr:phage major capsid protein [Clostridium botulinum]MBY6909516.1 phage major capsid protein [Clostridium botulinum]